MSCFSMRIQVLGAEVNEKISFIFSLTLFVKFAVITTVEK